MWSDGPGDLCVTVIHLHFGRPSSTRSIMYWSLLPNLHWSIPWESVPSQWYLGCMYCSIYSIMFCLAVVTNVLFFSPPIPWPWYNERSLLKLLVPVLLPSLSLAHPCPPWGIVASLALQTVICCFLLLITNILHWTLVSGGSMNIIQNVDVACLRGEARDSSWNTGSHPLPSFPEKPWPLWPTQWCWNPQDPNG